MLISCANFYQLQLRIVWYVLSELWGDALSSLLCVSQLYTLHLSNSWFLSLFTALSFFLWVSMSLTVSLTVVLYLFSEKHIGCLCCPFLCCPESLKATARGDHVKKKTQVFTVCVFVKESMHECLSLCICECAHPCVCRSVYVCAFICSVVLPFPALGMFKASSCAVRMCLSLFSKNTCSAFYQWAELGRPGAVQGWARIIKHQQILIHPDWNWLGLFAGLVWLDLVGHGGITVLECGGLVLLRDWRLFVVRLNWS